MDTLPAPLLIIIVSVYHCAGTRVRLARVPSTISTGPLTLGANDHVIVTVALRVRLPDADFTVNVTLIPGCIVNINPWVGEKILALLLLTTRRYIWHCPYGLVAWI